jgi:C4-type Zn-finger protein
MIKCPHCGSTAQMNYREYFSGETFGISYHIQEYKCECGYTRHEIDAHQYLGHTVEESIEGKGSE